MATLLGPVALGQTLLREDGAYFNFDSLQSDLPVFDAWGEIVKHKAPLTSDDVPFFKLHMAVMSREIGQLRLAHEALTQIAAGFQKMSEEQHERQSDRVRNLLARQVHRFPRGDILLFDMSTRVNGLDVQARQRLLAGVAALLTGPVNIDALLAERGGAREEMAAWQLQQLAIFRPELFETHHVLQMIWPNTLRQEMAVALHALAICRPEIFLETHIPHLIRAAKYDKNLCEVLIKLIYERKELFLPIYVPILLQTIEETQDKRIAEAFARVFKTLASENVAIRQEHLIPAIRLADRYGSILTGLESLIQYDNGHGLFGSDEVSEMIACAGRQGDYLFLLTLRHLAYKVPNNFQSAHVPEILALTELRDGQVDRKISGVLSALVERNPAIFETGDLADIKKLTGGDRVIAELKVKRPDLFPSFRVRTVTRAKNLFKGAWLS